MATHQVEEYYVHMSGLCVDDDKKKEIEDYLGEQGYSNYEFQDNDTVLVVDDIEYESSGETLEEEIKDLIYHKG